MSEKKNLEIVGEGVKETAKWAAIFAFFPEIKDVLGDVWDGLKALVLIFFHKSKNISEDTIKAVLKVKWWIIGILASFIVINMVITVIAAGSQIRALMAVAGGLLFILTALLASSGQVAAYIVGLYFATVEGGTKIFRGIAVKIADAPGIEMDENDFPVPEFINREKLAKNVSALWWAAALIVLIYAYMIAFISWAVLGVGLVMAFAIPGLALVIKKFNETDKVKDAELIIPTVKAKRRVAWLLSTGLTLFLVFSAIGITINKKSANPVAKSVANAADSTLVVVSDYVDDAGDLTRLPKKIVVDTYEATIKPVIDNRTAKKIAEALRQKAYDDSVKAYEDKASNQMSPLYVTWSAGTIVTLQNPNGKNFRINTSSGEEFHVTGEQTKVIQISFKSSWFIPTAENGTALIWIDRDEVKKNKTTIEIL